jgi:glycosyltransferase involved in cell wall biosynthesis
MRLAVYADYSYRLRDGRLSAELAFVRFLVGLADHVEGLTLVGRLDPAPGELPHRVPAAVGFEPLPHYASLSHPLRAIVALVRSLRRFWALLARVDMVWLFGPHPLAIAFAVLSAVRRRPFALGVRQDLPAYVATRHPHRAALRVAAIVLERIFRLLARRCTVVVVGSAIAEHYRASTRLLATSISLVPESELASPAVVSERQYDGELRVLSVGRLDTEKNPLLLVDVLERLLARDPRWRLVVCGVGSLEGELSRRLRERGLADRAELRGYVPLEGGLVDLYRSSHLLVHCSWTEGVPQVLIEAFAQRLPVVATAVGGVAGVAEGAALVVAPGNAAAVAHALEELAADEDLRQRLVDEGLERARRLSLESVTREVAEFLRQAGLRTPAGGPLRASADRGGPE